MRDGLGKFINVCLGVIIFCLTLLVAVGSLAALAHISTLFK